ELYESHRVALRAGAGSGAVRQLRARTRAREESQRARQVLVALRVTAGARADADVRLMQSGKEEEGHKELDKLASTDTMGAVAERALADIDFQLGNRDAAAKRFTNLVQNGRFVYESQFYLGAIAESRDSWDDALAIYGRVNGGEFAMAAQTRAARIKAKRQGLDAG